MNEELDILQSQVRRFLEREFVPHRERWEKQGFVDRDVWRKAGARRVNARNCRIWRCYVFKILPRNCFPLSNAGGTIPTQCGGLGVDDCHERFAKLVVENFKEGREPVARRKLT